MLRRIPIKCQVLHPNSDTAWQWHIPEYESLLYSKPQRGVFRVFITTQQQQQRSFIVVRCILLWSDDVPPQNNVERSAATFSISTRWWVLPQDGPKTSAKLPVYNGWRFPIGENITIPFHYIGRKYLHRERITGYHHWIETFRVETCNPTQWEDTTIDALTVDEPNKSLQTCLNLGSYNYLGFADN